MPSKPEILPYVRGSLKVEEIQGVGPAGMLPRGKSQRRRSARTVLREGAEECPKESLLALSPFSIQSAGDAGFGSRGEVSLPLCCRRGSGWGGPGTPVGAGGPRQGPEHPRRDGFACVGPGCL